MTVCILNQMSLAISANNDHIKKSEGKGKAKKHHI